MHTAFEGERSRHRGEAPRSSEMNREVRACLYVRNAVRLLTKCGRPTEVDRSKERRDFGLRSASPYRTFMHPSGEAVRRRAHATGAAQDALEFASGRGICFRARSACSRSLCTWYRAGVADSARATLARGSVAPERSSTTWNVQIVCRHVQHQPITRFDSARGPTQYNVTSTSRGAHAVQARSNARSSLLLRHARTIYDSRSTRTLNAPSVRRRLELQPITRVGSAPRASVRAVCSCATLRTVYD